MKKFIELTTYDGKKVSINIDHIQQFFPATKQDLHNLAQAKLNTVVTLNDGTEDSYYFQETYDRMRALVNTASY